MSAKVGHHTNASACGQPSITILTFNECLFNKNMKFPQTFIDELKHRVRISEVVGKSLMLKKAGREYHALCPFHKENTPSFTVNDEKGFYHCFGCAAHGDVIGFVMEYERVGYPEAVEKLAAMAGMALPEISKEAVAFEAKRQGALDIMQVLASWFAKALAESVEGEVARVYLAERGVSPEIIKKFGLGYAPSDRDILAKVMTEKGISTRDLIDAGVLIAVEGKAPYARFRRRLMFPIRDAKGRVIAFGGRVLPHEPNGDAAKYINSPETSLFHKGRNLYHIDRARSVALKSQMLVVAEGYMDVIAMAQAGMDYAVAPLGTAITQDQLTMLWSMVDEPVLCLDGDNAGLRAMNRAVDLALPMLRPKKSLRIVRLPKGEDPDSMLKKYGVQAFREVIEKALPLADILWEQAFSGKNTTPEARAGEERALMARIDRIEDADVKRYYREDVRQRLRSRAYAAGSQKFNPPKSAIPVMPPQPRDHDYRVAEAITKLCALASWYPPILADGARENAWLSLPSPLAWHSRLQHAVLDLAHNWDAQSAAKPIDGLSEIVIKALNDAKTALRLDNKADAIERGLMASRLWPELMNDVQRMMLMADIQQAEQMLAQEMNSAHFERLTELKAQLDHLQRERSIFYGQDPVAMG